MPEYVTHPFFKPNQVLLRHGQEKCWPQFWVIVIIYVIIIYVDPFEHYMGLGGGDTILRIVDINWWHFSQHGFLTPSSSFLYIFLCLIASQQPGFHVCPVILRGSCHLGGRCCWLCHQMQRRGHLLCCQERPSLGIRDIQGSSIHWWMMLLTSPRSPRITEVENEWTWLFVIRDLKGISSLGGTHLTFSYSFSTSLCLLMEGGVLVKLIEIATGRENPLSWPIMAVGRRLFHLQLNGPWDKVQRASGLDGFRFSICTSQSGGDLSLDFSPSCPDEFCWHVLFWQTLACLDSGQLFTWQLLPDRSHWPRNVCEDHREEFQAGSTHDWWGRLDGTPQALCWNMLKPYRRFMVASFCHGTDLWLALCTKFVAEVLTHLLVWKMFEEGWKQNLGTAPIQFHSPFSSSWCCDFCQGVGWQVWSHLFGLGFVAEGFLHQRCCKGKLCGVVWGRVCAEGHLCRLNVKDELEAKP